MKSLKSNSEPLVTIGIPTYNRPSELQKAIEASINQSYRNLEIIISDNCSPDPKVEELCREYADKDKRIKYFRQSENLGMGSNGEFVLNSANGEYFMWCMDDDWLSLNYIEESIKFLLNHLDYVIAYGEMNFYNIDYSIARRCKQHAFTENCDTSRVLKYCATAMSSSLSFGLTTTKLMRKVFINKMRLPADWIVMIKLLYEGKGVFIENISYNALNNGSSKNIESLKIAFNLPNLTQDNFWNVMAENIIEAVIFDDFFQEKISKEEIISLALNINNTLMNNNAKLSLIKKIISRIKLYIKG